jgi:heat shock protein HtpX
MFSRIVLFLATNFAVLILAGIIMSVLGVNPNQMSGLLVMAAVFGFGGSFISLLLSKFMAKRTGAQVITSRAPKPNAGCWKPCAGRHRRPASACPRWRSTTARRSMLSPPAPIATALVAVSTGLLQQMDRDEAEAVLGHEISHVANGDMVTMALLQGVLNTFVIVLARVVGGIIDGYLSGNRDDGRRGFAYYIIVMVLEMVFGLFATMIAMVLAPPRIPRRRRRRTSGRQKMIAALQRLSLNHGQSTLPTQVAAFGIAGGVGEGLRKLFLSHPPLEERIAALRSSTVV